MCYFKFSVHFLLKNVDKFQITNKNNKKVYILYFFVCQVFAYLLYTYSLIATYFYRNLL